MAKIALEMERALARRALNGTPGRATSRALAQGDGWVVEDVVCTSGPQDRPFEERHSHFSIAIVAAGTFQYRASTSRSRSSRELMTPGSLLLGSPGQSFECGHEHGSGDRCLAFRYSPDFFERLAADVGNAKPGFRVLRVPPLRALSSVVARACAGLIGRSAIAWEELSLQLAAKTVQIASSANPDPSDLPVGAIARVTQIVRRIERHPEGALSLEKLADEAGLSRYHFLRIFERVTGVTPHQYVLRTRLRQAAIRLADEPAKVLDIALDCGFGDVSNFNHAFRAEFGVSPRVYRQHGAAAAASHGRDAIQVTC